MARNLVLCLDGTGNQVTSPGLTNVFRLYGLLQHLRPDQQVAYYDPGLGTFSLQGAISPFGRVSTRLAGLAFGVGLRQNVSEAYTFLLRNYMPGDRIFLFGFSRGAYTATVLAALVQEVGILRPGAENLVPYLAERYVRSRDFPDELERIVSQRFSNSFRNWGRIQDGLFSPGSIDELFFPVHFVGLWDTVNAVGFLRKQRIQPARYLRGVRHVRHAVSIDEARVPYRPELVDPTHEDLVEVWFSGVHSDIGGGFVDDGRLAEVTLHWMMVQASRLGLLLDPLRQEEFVSEIVRRGPRTFADGKVHDAGFAWRLVGNRRRVIPPGARLHVTALQKVERDPRYHLLMPRNASWEDSSGFWAD